MKQAVSKIKISVSKLDTVNAFISSPRRFLMKNIFNVFIIVFKSIMGFFFANNFTISGQTYILIGHVP